MSTPAKKLSAKQRLFVHEYLVDLNGTQAAIRVGYAPHSASQTSDDLLRIPQVKDAIEKAMRAREQRTQVKSDRVLYEIARLAFSDLRKACEWGGERLKMTDSDKIDEDTAAAIREVTVRESKAGTSISLKLHDKAKALDMLMRHLGLYEKNADETSQLRDELRKLSDEELTARAEQAFPELKKVIG